MPLNRTSFVLLIALALAVIFLALEPLLSFALFGSDTGEYFRLTQSVLTTGHIPRDGAYAGWGFGYPDFPGLFVFAATAAGALGLGPLASLIVVVPAVAALSVVPLFLLFRRIFPNDLVALFGAGLATVAFPRLFLLAHPAPLALGDFLVVGALWMFVEGRRDRRWYALLVPTLAALLVTHHLSSYFFAVSALGGLLILELWRPGSWGRRFPLRELVVLAAFLSGMFAYWIDYASSFRTILISTSSPTVLLALTAGAVLGAAGLGVLAGAAVRWRRRQWGSRPHPVSLPTDRSLARDFAIIGGGLALGLGFVAVVPVPPTNQTTSFGAIAFFLPYLVTIVFVSGSRRLVTTAPLGPFAIAWLVALSAATLLAIFTPAGKELIPGRHAEYLAIPVALLAAMAIGRLAARARLRSGRPAVAAGVAAGIVLLGANAAIAYPPAADFGGFQEGLTGGDSALWMWAGVGLPAGVLVASDHRLSSMLFGFDGLPATWQSTPGLFTGSSFAVALSELENASSPRERLAVSAVAVDGVMLSTGVALDPNQLALPMSAAAKAWFAAPPFVPLYENGAERVYWVDLVASP